VGAQQKSVKQEQQYQVSQPQRKNGKDLNDKITIIEARIQKIKEEKKRMNVNFKPYADSDHKSTCNPFKNSWVISKF
jgi:hypothetical protein